MVKSREREGRGDSDCLFECFLTPFYSNPNKTNFKLFYLLHFSHSGMSYCITKQHPLESFVEVLTYILFQIVFASPSLILME